MKYGIWCKYGDTFPRSDEWVSAGLATDIVKSNISFYDNDGRFYTFDINIAYRYMEYLINYYTDHDWIFEVKEK